MSIPEKIKIGGITYDVEIVDEIDNGNSAGEIITEKQLIRISRGKTDYMNATFLHEVIHAMNMEIREVETEFLAEALYQVINDNPDIFRSEVS